MEVIIAPGSDKAPFGRPLVIAHRALTPGMPENAIPSILRAAGVGADLAEIDIRLSLDRRPVVTHDAFLGRSTHGHGWVRMWPSFLLQRLRLRADMTVRLPTVREVLRMLPEDLQPAFHLKDAAALVPVLREIEVWGHPERTWLWLERPRDVAKAVARAPGVRCTLLRPGGWTPENRQAYMSDAKGSGAAAVSLPWGVIDAELVALAHQHGLMVFTREEASPSIADRVRVGVDGIITDDPASTREAIDRAMRS
jgi:glycerophosphoryl diester phosphodiesterase